MPVASNPSSDVTITAEPFACTSDISASYSGWKVSLIDSSTLLLLESDTFNGDTSIVDSGGATSCPHPPTIVGNITHSTDKSKFGASSIKTQFSTSQNPYVEFEIPQSEFSPSNDFSVDLWIFIPDAPVPSIGFFEAYDYDYYNWFALTSKYDTALQKHYISLFAASPVITTQHEDFYFDNIIIKGAWNHFEFTRSNNQLYAFCNGILDSRCPLSFNYSFTAQELVSCFYFYDTPSEGDTGYFDELRLSNVARHTADFTPLTLPYSSYIQIEGIDADGSLVSSIEEATINITRIIKHEQRFSSPAIIVTREVPTGTLSLQDTFDKMEFLGGNTLELFDPCDFISFSVEIGSIATLSLFDSKDVFASLNGGEFALEEPTDSLSFTGQSEVIGSFALIDSKDTAEFNALAGIIGSFNLFDLSDEINIEGLTSSIGFLNLLDSNDTIFIQALPGGTAEFSLFDPLDSMEIEGYQELRGELSLEDVPDAFILEAVRPSRFTDHIIQYQKARY